MGALGKHFTAVLILLRRPDIKLKGTPGWETPLIWAITHLNTEFVTMEACVDLDARDKEGRPPLSHAVDSNVEIAGLLLNLGRVKPNIPGNSGRSLSFWIIQPKAVLSINHEIRLVNLFLEDDRVDPNLQDIHGSTPLSWAARQGYTEIVDLLLEKDSIEVQDKYGLTPLSWAARAGQYDLVANLLKKHAVRLNIPDKHGRMPIDIANTEGHSAVVELLRGEEKPEIPSILVKALRSLTVFRWSSFLSSHYHL